jgi:hypothetical protein
MNSSGLSTQLSSAENNRLQGTSNRAVARSAAPEAERYAHNGDTMIKKLTQRYDQLLKEVDDIESKKYKKQDSQTGHKYDVIDHTLLLTWKVKARNLIVKTCGENSEHYKEFVVADQRKGMETDYGILKKVRSVFIAAKDDYQNGFLTSTKILIQAEVFDCELEQAKELLKANYYLAAAVIAGVVLETSLRDMCNREGIDIGKLDKMNSDLAKAGIYTKLHQKRITAIADIRNSAAHGKLDEFSSQDVELMIRDVEQFLITFHSGA